MRLLDERFPQLFMAAIESVDPLRALKSLRDKAGPRCVSRELMVAAMHGARDFYLAKLKEAQVACDKSLTRTRQLPRPLGEHGGAPS